MARRSQWRLWTLSATLIVLLRAGWIAVMTVVLQNGSARQLTPRELAELNGEAPAHSGRQSRPGHDRRRKSLLHGASRPSGATPATRRGRAAASPPTGGPLQTFQRGWFEKHQLAAKEFTDTTLLSIFMGGPFLLHTAKTARMLDEIRTLKIRAAGSSLPAAKALGMTPVTLAANEAYEAAQRGTVDGALFPWEAMTSFRLNELLKYHLEVPGGLGAPAFVIVANPRAIEKLTPENRAALLKASGEAGSALFGKAWQAADEHGRKDAQEKGQTIETLAPAEMEKWRPMLETVAEDWVKKAD